MPNLRFLWVFFISSLTMVAGLPARAQITPDQTLSGESSIVMPDTEVRGQLADLIEGGAARGPNLFHSFSDFNVLAAERVYFANPEGIESILSRVTGTDLSNIFGTLGIDGAANLFLINPNGIVFGPDVNLDVEGALYATTAEAVALGIGIFSASTPEQSQLLLVTPDTSFFNYLTAESGNIVNRGQVSANGNVTLAANSLDLQGQVASGGDLSLLAADTVQIRDTTEMPFVVFSGGDLLVQGNRQIDIVALSHPESGLFSYGDMVLRSDEQVGGDTHYWSGGNFRIEQANGEAGRLFSPIDPVIRAYGDVNLGSYQGSSLHVIAGGSVEIGRAIVSFPEQGIVGNDFLQDSVELSNGIVVGIDGSTQPTVDIRAGVQPSAVGNSASIGLSGFDFGRDFLSSDSFGTDTPSSGNITIGNIFIPSATGRVLLTNQYQPNLTLEDGNIAVLGGEFNPISIDLRNFSGPSGDVFIDARGNVDILDGVISTTAAGDVGDVIVLAGETVTFSGQEKLAGISTNLSEQGRGTGGTIFISAENLNAFHGTQLQSSLIGKGQGGNIILDIRGTALFSGKSLNNAISNPELPLARALSRIEPGGQGQGGSIFVKAENLTVTDGGQLSASTLGGGNAGNVVLQIANNILLQGSAPDASNSSSIISTVGRDAIGTGGDIYATAEQIEVINGAVLATLTSGRGDAGNIFLEIDDVARFSGAGDLGISAATTRTTPGSVGNGGVIQIKAHELEVLNGAQLSSSTSGDGNAGNIILDIDDTVTFSGFVPRPPSSIGQTVTVSGASASSLAGSTGRGGEIKIEARNLLVTNGAQIISSVFGEGSDGRIDLNIDEDIYLGGRNPIDNAPSGVVTGVPPQGSGNGGDIDIDARNLSLAPGSAIDARHDSLGSSGDINITVSDAIRSFDGDFRTSATFGSAGDINLTANTIVLKGDSDIKTVVDSGLEVGEGATLFIRQGNVFRSFFYLATESDGGNINIKAKALVALDDSDILSFTDGGRGGEVNFGQTAFFGQNYETAPFGTDPLALDENEQVDINTSGPLAAGDIITSDVSFVENNLAELTDNLVNPETLVANSCIVRSESDEGTFVFSGSDRLPQSPREASSIPYTLGTVQPIATTATLVEPEDIRRLADGRLVMSRLCE